MSFKTAAPAPLRFIRRRATSVRPPRRANVIVATIAAVLGVAGVASAATGGTFTLGRSNTETSSARLSDSHGTPLALSAPKNKAPLAVNRNVMVKNLNTQYVGGLTASSFKLAGGQGWSAPGADIAIPDNQFGQLFDEIRQTGMLPAGTYYVTATAVLGLAFGDTGGFCDILNNDNEFQSQGEANGVDWAGPATTAVVTLPSPGVIKLACGAIGTVSGSSAFDGAITAIKVRSSSRG